MRIISIKFPIPLLVKVDSLAYNMGISRAEVIRNAVFQTLTGGKVITKSLAKGSCQEIVVKIEDWVVHDLDEFAKSYSISRSELIRRACYNYLMSKGKIKPAQQYEEEPPIKARVEVTRL